MFTRRVLFASLVLLAAPFAARAHREPPACFQTGIALSVQTFRADQTTGVVGTIQDCEQIYYRVILFKNPNDANTCAFSGGTLSLTTPDTVVHSISASVPCLGGSTGEGCVAGVDSLQSGFISYTASPGDVSGGNVVATANYTGGSVHDVVGNTGGAGASISKATPVVACAATTTVPTTSTSSTTTTLPKSVCTSAKLVAASKLALALAKCDAKAAKAGVAVVQQCRDTAIAKFVTKWASLDLKPDCLTSNDVAGIQGLIEACMQGLANSLLPYLNP